MATITEMQDMSRWAPSAQQISTAKALLRGMGSHCEVVVPIALHNKHYGVWTTSVDVEPIEGVYIVVGDIRGRAVSAGAVDYGMGVEIVERVARVNSRAGTGSYACIDRDGHYAVFEVTPRRTVRMSPA